jgi:hypothetical protein
MIRIVCLSSRVVNKDVSHKDKAKAKDLTGQDKNSNNKAKDKLLSS